MKMDCVVAGSSAYAYVAKSGHGHSKHGAE
jgi:hypothetical protein